MIALDPGGTTGWSTYTAGQMIGPTGELEFYDEEWACGQLGPGPHHEELWDLLHFQRVESYFVVCESFEFRGGAAKVRDNLNLDSKEYIGVAKLYSQTEGVPLRFQTAAMGKGFITDSKIKKAMLWYPNQKHAMDATRHLLYALVNSHGRSDLVRQFWGPEPG